MIDCFFGLGANLGDRMTTLAKALELVAHTDGFSLRGVSRVWETAPVGPPQPRYLNAVARVGSMLSARATLKRLLDIEEKLGRIRREKWGPREIDLDLLFYGNAVSPGPIELPHPRLHERAFVLAPLSELAPQLVHPLHGKSVESLLAALGADARAGVQVFGPLRRRLDGPESDLEALPEGEGEAGAAPIV